MSMLREGASGEGGWALELLSFLADYDLGLSTLGDLVSPPAAVVDLVKGEAGRTFVAVGLAINALPEDAAVLLVGEGSVEVGAVPGGDCWLQVEPVSAFHEVKLGALLEVVRGVGVHEGEAVAAKLQVGDALVTVPVLVTAS
jgi:hypothetical protein